MVELNFLRYRAGAELIYQKGALMVSKIFLSFLCTVHLASASFAGEIATTHPFVLIPGLFGFDGEIFFKTYFGDIAAFLQEKGATVIIADLSPVHSTAYRAEQLYEQLKALDHEKYHLIGHSQGGLVARAFEKNYPHLVDFITTIGTPNHGSLIADSVFKWVEANPLVAKLIWSMGDYLGCTLDLLSRHYKQAEQFSKELMAQLSEACSHAVAQIKTNSVRHNYEQVLCRVSEVDVRSHIFEISTLVCKTIKNTGQTLCSVYAGIREQNAKEAIKSLTTQEAQEFNAIHTKGISQELSEYKLFSWGTYDACRNSSWDFAGLSLQLSGWLFFGEKNDGMVSLKSMKYGTWLGELPGAHHLIPAHNGLASFPPHHIEWYRARFLEFLERIAEEPY